MATYSGNSTIKVNGAVSGYQTRGSTGSTAVYTAPANGYALVNIRFAWSGGTHELRIGGRTLGTTSGSTFTGVTVGPGQSVEVFNAGVGGSCEAWVSGVEFVNTP